MRNEIRLGGLGIVVLAGVLSLVACSSNAEAEKVGTDQAMLQEGACIREVLGGDKSCKALDQWKQFAAQACENRGLALSDLAPGAECQGGFSDVTYACCKQGPQPVPPKEPGEAACFGDAQGGPQACKPAEEWTKLASALCTAKGSSLSQVTFAEGCQPGSFRFTKYVCCEANKPPPPPAPPPVCVTEKIDDGKLCVEPGAIKERAFDLCAARKLVLTDLGIDGDCTPDRPGVASVTCCAPAEVQPPDPQPKDPQAPPPDRDPPVNPDGTKPLPPQDPNTQCFASAASLGACAGDDALKELAVKTCAGRSADVTLIEFSRDCGDQGSSKVAFTCCARP
jgi:hypothetical protein